MMTSEDRERVRTLLAAWREERRRSDEETRVDPPPRYDEVFHRGVAWLDSLAVDEDPEAA